MEIAVALRFGCDEDEDADADAVEEEEDTKEAGEAVLLLLTRRGVEDTELVVVAVLL